MECNKEEAMRAKEIAENRMRDGDFVGAQKIARKAQQLFPSLDNISQLLAVCEVHCSAQNRILGSEMDWYKVLQIELSADDMIIKKQYRKLALILHPDKNKFPGAEAAFKLIGEANRVLSDKTKRSVYDVKLRATTGPYASKQQPHQAHKNTVRKQPAAASNPQKGPHSQFGAANNAAKAPYFRGAHPSQNVENATFWTFCAACGIRYQYHRTHVNKVLRCQSCNQSFTAYDLGARGMSSGFPWNQFPNQNGVPKVFQNGFPNPGSSKVASQSGHGKPSAMPQERVDTHVNVKEGVRMPKPGVANGKEGVGKPKPYGGKSSECGTSRNSGKRKRKSEDESSESYVVGNGDDDEDGAATSFGQNTGATRKSLRRRQNVSYCEKKNEDNDFVSPAKRSNWSRPSNAGEEKAEEGRAVECETKEKDDNCAAKPEILEYPDPEFNDFDKDRAENCFAVNQVWAIYDLCDGMPRFYARVMKVFSPGFKVRMTWLEPDPEGESENAWCDVELPVACGKYANGNREEIKDHLMFSHQMSVIKGASRSSYVIYPKKGETWALFRDWDIKWSSDPEKHKPPYHFDFVEILTDFTENFGIGVAYLGKVEGYVSVFQRKAKHGVVSFHVAPTELYRFSHRIPSYRLTGKEKTKENKGVPEGFFELDPASLPNFDELSDPDDYKMENQKLDSEATMDCKKSSTTKKHESDRKMENREMKNHNQVEASQFTSKKDGNEDMMDFISSQAKGNTTYAADEKTRKQEDSDFATEAMQLRKSPRDLSKKSNQISASQPTTEEDANKHLDAKKNKTHHGVAQSNESASPSVSDGKMHLPVRNGSSTNVLETSSTTPSLRVAEAGFYDFKVDKTMEKFECDQIWALYGDNDTMPRSYAQVKLIESTPEFRLHVALLEACSPSKHSHRPVCCGTFKLKNGNNKVLPLTAFSHRLEAKPVDKNKFEVYPRKGEVWALYKNGFDKGGCEIVEVLEDNGQCIKAVVLTCVNGSKSLYRAPRSQRSKFSFVEIQRSDVTKFSHQIPACQLNGEKELQFKGYWNLDHLAIPGTVICLE